MSDSLTAACGQPHFYPGTIFPRALQSIACEPGLAYHTVFHEVCFSLSSFYCCSLLWHHISISESQITTTRLSVQQPVQSSNNEIIKALHYWPFVRGITGFLHKGPVMWKAVPRNHISAKYHALNVIFAICMSQSDWISPRYDKIWSIWTKWRMFFYIVPGTKMVVFASV